MNCDICNKSFNNSKSLSNHRRWHNLDEYKIFQNKFKLKVKKFNLGSKNGMWKGNELGYMALHDYIKYHLKKSEKCEDCNKLTDKLDLANISGEYKRDFDDWEWLCRKCHMIKDGRLKKLINSRYKEVQKN